jgi:pectate lyase
MRYKSMPLSARNPSPRGGQQDPAPTKRGPTWIDWLLTVPVLLLVPALVVPLLVMGGKTPSLAVNGTAYPGATIVVTGDGFRSSDSVQLSWDGVVARWLPSATSDRAGTFREPVKLPATVATGKHMLAARVDVTHGKSKKRWVLAASIAVTVSALAGITGSPTPTPTPAAGIPSPTASASAAATPSASPPPTPAATPPPATSGYIGYGAESAGGRGGVIRTVTNLNDSGPGSLRAALEASGPRIVTFDIAGTISLQSDLRIANPYITVAGETAPSPGIVVRFGSLKVDTHDVILRQLRLRPSDLVEAPADDDALTLNGLHTSVFNVVVDHVSMVWGPDIGGLAVLGNVHDATISNSIMGEGLYFSRHPEAIGSEGGHAMAANVTQMDAGQAWPTRITLWHNLFTTADTRMPRLQGASCVDIVDNVIYNWGTRSAGGNPRSANVVNNWYRSGPETVAHEFWGPQTSTVVPTLFTQVVYQAGNVADGFTASPGGPTSVYVASVRCGGLSVAAGAPSGAYASVLAAAGATLPVRDVVDQRIIGNVIARRGAFFNGMGYPAPNPYYP